MRLEFFVCTVAVSLSSIVSLALAGGGGDSDRSHPKPKPIENLLTPDFTQPALTRVLGVDTKILTCKGNFNVNVYTLTDGALGVNVNTIVNTGTGPTNRGSAFMAKGFVNILGEAYIEISSDPNATEPDPSQTIVIANILGLGLRGKVTAFMPFIGAHNESIVCELRK